MDIEFHYYMTYLIAARAGFKPAEATIIAHAAQSVDDNHLPVKVKGANGSAYLNAISQTMDITRPHEDSQIYPVFHFIPGDPYSPSAERQDGKIHNLNTTPNSALANAMIDTALASGDLYRIGVSTHGYVDTWAHQNFVGKRDAFNDLGDTELGHVTAGVLAVGHAYARHMPDMPGLIWTDRRLKKPEVNNRERFLDAAEHLFRKFSHHLAPTKPDDDIARDVTRLRDDLDADIGARDDANAHVNDRIARYTARASTAPYGAAPIPSYVVGAWFSDAIVEPRAGVLEKLRERLLPEDALALLDDILDDANREEVTWKNPDPQVFRQYAWFKFQEAVRAHLDECTGLLVKEGIA